MEKFDNHWIYRRIWKIFIVKIFEDLDTRFFSKISDLQARELVDLIFFNN